MAGEQPAYQGYNVDLIIRLRDLEDKQRILKNQILMLGKNLIETKEKSTQDIIEIKKEIDIIKNDIERMNVSVDSVSEEISKFARKDDVEILQKQMRMFQPFGGRK